MEGSDPGPVPAQWLSRVRGRSWRRLPCLLYSSLLQPDAAGESLCLWLWRSTEDATVTGQRPLCVLTDCMGVEPSKTPVEQQKVL